MKKLIAILLLPSLNLHAAEEGLLHQWRFAPEKIKEGTVEPITGSEANFAGTASVLNEGGLDQLELKGTDSRAWVTDDFNSVKVPQKTITVEAWVSPASLMRWGGIAGIIQDNGDYERGWLLGYVNRKFSFALASKGHQRLTYLQGTTDFKDKFWYHVVGTYDGEDLKVYVNGKLEGTEPKHSGDIIYPPKATFELGGYKDDNEFYRGAISLHEISIYEKVLGPETIAKRFAARKNEFPLPPEPLGFVSSPQVRWKKRDTLQMEWELPEALPVEISWKRADGTELRKIPVKAAKKGAALIDQLKPEGEYLYRFTARKPNGSEFASQWHKFDTSFYYSLPEKPVRPIPFTDDKQMKLVQSAAQHILEQSGINQGYALILGSAGGRLAYELARQTEMQVVVVEPDETKAQAARKALAQAGLYGVRASVHQDNLDDLPYGAYFANLITSGSLLTEGNLPGQDASQLMHVLRPAGGVVMLGQLSGKLNKQSLQDWFKKGETQCTVSDVNGGLWAHLKRPKLDGAGDWTHQYGSADNTTNSRDDLVRGEMGILWWGEPGPRPMPDRGGRNPAPLAANGRMFVQGDRVLFGLDAYNGTVLWTFFSPEMRRSNMPRDGSNMVATDDTLFVTISGECIALDAQTGKRRVGLHAPKDRDWGWLSASGGQLIMAAVKQGAAYKADSGEWYDSFGAGQVDRVVSDALVSHDSVTGRKQWTYRGGAVMNSTLTVAGDEIYFVESRNPDLAKSGAGRHMPASLNAQHLVALDRSSGRKLWEKPVDFSKCEHMLYLIHAKGTLLAAGSDRAKKYHTYAYDVSSPALRFGEKPIINADIPLLWKKEHVAGIPRRGKPTTDHGGLIQHPLVVQEVVYTDNRAYALRTGKDLNIKLPDRVKCGNMAASNHSMFFRNFYHGIWDMETDERIQLEGIRSGCWLGIIPAQGLMLAPESSSGCSCTHSIQTSAAWIPKASLRKPKKNR